MKESEYVERLRIAAKEKSPVRIEPLVINRTKSMMAAAAAIQAHSYDRYYSLNHSLYLPLSLDQSKSGKKLNYQEKFKYQRSHLRDPN